MEDVRLDASGDDLGQDERSLVKLPFTLLGKKGERKDELKIRSEWAGKDARGKSVRFYKEVTGTPTCGLPDYPAEEVYVALLYLTLRQGLGERTVRFVPRQLLQLMHWSDGGEDYRRLQKSLDQLAGVRIVTNALWDEPSKAFVKRANFGIVSTWKRRSDGGAPLFGEDAGETWEVTWNEELLAYFQRARFKPLNVRTFYGLSTPLAKRLYRWLDEALYPTGRAEIDVLHLAHTRLEMSRTVRYPSQAIQKMRTALDELAGRGVCTWAVEPSGTGSGKKFVFVRPRAVAGALTSNAEGAVALTSNAERATEPNELTSNAERPEDWLDVALAVLPEAERARLETEALGRLDPYYRQRYAESGGGAPAARAQYRLALEALVRARTS